MASPIIQIRRSAVAGKIPTTTQLSLGELAINTYDGKIYIEQDQGAVGVGTTVIVINPWNVGVGSEAYNINFTAGFVGIGTTNPSSKLHIVGNALVTGIITASSLSGYQTLVGTASSATKTFTVTVANKTSNHRYFGSGSSQGYFIDGAESPFITLLPGKTYRFDQADSSNSSHPLRFYLEANRTTQYTTNVTTNGTAGSAGAYTEITIVDTTPIVLHYQCSNHAGMGNAVSNAANFIDTPYQITARSGINATGVVTATTFVGALTGNVTGNVTGNATGLSGTPNITVGSIAATSLNASGVVTATSFSGDGSQLTGISVGSASQFVTTAAGIHTLSNVGIGTTNPTSKLTVTGNGIFTGVVTATTFVGAVTGNVTGNATGLSGTPNITVGTIGATSLNASGVVTATTFVGAVTGNVTGNATGLSGTPNITVGTIAATSLNASGVVTASSFSGAGTGLTGIPAAQLTGVLPALDGSALTGVTASGTGIVIKEEGTTIGTAGTINFVGAGVTATFSSGTATVSITAGGGGSVSIGTAAPSTPTAGSLWYNTNLARTFVYYNDGSSSQWVDVAPFNQGGTNSTVQVSSSAPTSPTEGQLWYNTILARTFIYYSDGTSSQWVDAAPFNTQSVNKTLTIGTRTTAATLTLVGTGLTIALRSGVGTASF